MYSLTSTLSTASEALNATDGAIAVVNNNISNVDTPGYSRQVVNLSAAALNGDGQPIDNGVSFNGYTSVRDQVLQASIVQKTSDAASLTAQSSSWSQIEGAFSSTTSGIGSAISGLFSALSALSTTPTDPASRQTAFSAASGVASAFQQASTSLSNAQASADQTVSATVAQVNQLSSQIAGLDAQLSQTQSGSGTGALQDQRDELTLQLAQLTGLNVVQTEGTPTLSLADGTPLVIGGTAYALQSAQGTDGQTHIFTAQGQDVTAGIQGGSLGGALTMRDSTIPGLSAGLNELAQQFGTAMNAAQASGYDPSGTQGQAMFSFQPGQGAAAGISVSLASAAGLATSADGSAGSSGNVATLLAVQSQALPSGATASQAYAGFAQNIGTLSAGTSTSLTATNAALDHLNAQQSSTSGVSVDEETTNLIRYQQAYAAAAQVISTINNLFSVVLNMGTVTS